jgi:hypothetical protein
MADNSWSIDGNHTDDIRHESVQVIAALRTLRDSNNSLCRFLTPRLERQTVAIVDNNGFARHKVPRRGCQHHQRSIKMFRYPYPASQETLKKFLTIVSFEEFNIIWRPQISRCNAVDPDVVFRPTLKPVP